ncbi:MAG: NAD(P)-dependent oxidoreductase [Chloroflexi bacterium]|nr:NAD(P)-dependent oxidoreductase [Chloroflexota bacterium]
MPIAFIHCSSSFWPVSARSPRSRASIGTGIMGLPMATNLIRAGYLVSVFSRTRERAEPLIREGATWCASPKAVAESTDVVISIVSDSPDVEEVYFDAHGVCEGIKPDGLCIDMSTIAPDVARAVAERLRERGGAFLDAPVSGGQAGAESGKLTIMVGGEAAMFGRAAAVMGCYSKSVQLMGPVGAGQLTKMVNQICIAGLVQGLAEGLRFAEAAELDAKAVAEVISKGAAQSWQMDNRAETMIDGKFDFGFAVDWMRKDLGFCLEEARRLGISIPVAELVDGFYGEVQEMGGGRWDTSSLIARLCAASRG